MHRMRHLTAGFAIAIALLTAGPASARAKADGHSVSPCGRHVWEARAGAVRVDGRAVHTNAARVIAVRPVWRADGGAVAWIEREGTRRRLVVVPNLREAPLQVLTWPLPAANGIERIFWMGSNRISVGAKMLAPRAVASWSQEPSSPEEAAEEPRRS